MQFSEFNLTPDLLRGIEEAGYAESTDVQQETLTHTLTGRDVFVQSQTGTGKTAAFLISLFELIERGAEREKAIIISPTRELAVQIAEEAKLLSLYLEFNIATIYGGVGYNQQLRAIAEGVDIIIGTPGRLIDMSNRRMLNLHQFNYVVIDEADRMFDMGFVHDIQTILYKLPPKESRQTMLFSATLTPAVKHLASGSMKNPAEVHIVSQNVTVDTINQQVYHVGSAEKMSLLLGIIKKYNTSRTLIFVNMKQIAEELAERLKENGFTAEYLTGDLAQGQRQRRIDQFKNNELPILVATDVAARGIHIDDLELVVNYDIPMHSENYVHRIGRTARAGKSGHAITLACETFVEFLQPIEKFINMKLPSSVPDEELFAADVTAGKNYRRRRSSPRGDSRPRRSGSSGGGRRTDNRSRGSTSYSSNRQRSTGQRPDRRPPEQRTDGKRSAPPRTGQHSGETRRATGDGNKPVRRSSEGRIPASHSHDKKAFEHKQHPAPPPQHEKTPPKAKKGLFSKVMSLFK